LCIAVLLSVICLVLAWPYLVLVVAANDLSLCQLARCTTKSPELLMSFSNHARTPLGIFLTMNLLGLNMVLLV
jgi:hypothetical protein